MQQAIVTTRGQNVFFGSEAQKYFHFLAFNCSACDFKLIFNSVENLTGN